MEFLHSASRWAAKDSFATASNTFNVDVATTTGQQYIQGVLLFGAIYIAVGLLVWCIVTALDCCLCCRSRKRMALARQQDEEHRLLKAERRKRDEEDPDSVFASGGDAMVAHSNPLRKNGSGVELLSKKSKSPSPASGGAGSEGTGKGKGGSDDGDGKAGAASASDGGSKSPDAAATRNASAGSAKAPQQQQQQHAPYYRPPYGALDKPAANTTSICGPKVCYAAIALISCAFVIAVLAEVRLLRIGAVGMLNASKDTSAAFNAASINLGLVNYNLRVVTQTTANIRAQCNANNPTPEFVAGVTAMEVALAGASAALTSSWSIVNTTASATGMLASATANVDIDDITSKVMLGTAIFCAALILWLIVTGLFALVGKKDDTGRNRRCLGSVFDCCTCCVLNITVLVFVLAGIFIVIGTAGSDICYNPADGVSLLANVTGALPAPAAPVISYYVSGSGEFSSLQAASNSSTQLCALAAYLDASARSTARNNFAQVNTGPLVTQATAFNSTVAASSYSLSYEVVHPPISRLVRGACDEGVNASIAIWAIATGWIAVMLGLVAARMRISQGLCNCFVAYVPCGLPF